MSDSAVAGAGAYAETGVGGCGSTGDGDIHLRFLPCYQARPSTPMALLACHMHAATCPVLECYVGVEGVPLRRADGHIPFLGRATDLKALDSAVWPAWSCAVSWQLPPLVWQHEVSHLGPSSQLHFRRALCGAAALCSGGDHLQFSKHSKHLLSLWSPL